MCWYCSEGIGWAVYSTKLNHVQVLSNCDLIWAQFSKYRSNSRSMWAVFRFWVTNTETWLHNSVEMVVISPKLKGLFCVGKNFSISEYYTRNGHKKVNYTPWPESTSELYRPSDRRLSAKLVPTFAVRRSHVVSMTHSAWRILGFLDRSRYIFF
jgi:hypothetical protein